MARSRSAANSAAVSSAVAFFRKLPGPAKGLLVVLLAVGVGAYFLVQWRDHAAAQQATAADGENEFLFCFWNVENLFDDKDDKRNSIDEEFDQPFFDNPRLLELKLDRISSALLKMNGGKGPDVIACVEVESVRAGELLQQALNAKLKAAKADDKLQYKHLLMQDLNAGRHIAPCVISRVGVDAKNVKLLKKPLRILETHLVVNGKDLTVVVGHWTSQLRQQDGSDGDSGREKYANAIYDRYIELTRKDANTDFLVCGDFNDSPDADPIVKNLGAIGDPTKVKPDTDPPYLLNLMSGKDPAKFGTLWYNGKPLIYDHVCVSAGMLDEKGWSVDPKSVTTPTDGLTKKGSTRREPWRFENPGKEVKDDARGYADHFPVTVKLKVEAVKK